MVRLTQQFVLASDPEVGPTDGRFFGERAGYYIIGGEGGGYRTGNRDIYICIYVRRYVDMQDVVAGRFIDKLDNY